MQQSCLHALFSVVDTELKAYKPGKEEPSRSSSRVRARLARCGGLAQKTAEWGADELAPHVASAFDSRLVPGQRAQRGLKRVRGRSPSGRLRASQGASPVGFSPGVGARDNPDSSSGTDTVLSAVPGGRAQPVAGHYSGNGGGSSASSEDRSAAGPFPIFVGSWPGNSGAPAAGMEGQRPDGARPAVGEQQQAAIKAEGPASDSQVLPATGVPAMPQLQAGGGNVAQHPTPGGVLGMPMMTATSGPTALGTGMPTKMAHGQAAMMPQAAYYGFPPMLPMSAAGMPGTAGPFQQGMANPYFAAAGMMMPSMGMPSLPPVYTGAPAPPSGVSQADNAATGGGGGSGSGDSSPNGREAKKPRSGGASGFAAKHPGTSGFRGVSWHTQTGRWKAQIKVNGRDVNLGRHKDEVAAARAYDRAALCARGVDNAKLNFPLDDYADEVPELQNRALDDLAASLRGVEERQAAQTSRFHGVRLNKRTKKWEAYIRVNGKHVHLGCYDHEVAAAQAFDQAAIVRHAYNLGAMGGKPHLVTNFPPDYYQNLLQSQQAAAAAGADSAAAAAAASAAGGGMEGHSFYKLEEKYVQNLVDKCREQGGDATEGGEDGEAGGAR